MRIVAGSLRGRVVAAPDGDGTRPTVDRVREALFSSLYSLLGGFEDIVALDAFAGSGALGIEALSRGAARAVFYERDAKAAAVVSHNLASCDLDSSRATVVKRDVMQAPPTNALQPFGLVFLDPPYAHDVAQVMDMVRALADAGALAEGAVVVYEHDAKAKESVAQAFESANFDIIVNKNYGKTGITTGRLR